MTERRTRTFHIALAVTAVTLAAVGGLAWAPTAKADPIDCDFTHTCSYDPPFNGPMPNTWDVPGTYGGWTTLPLICDPITGACRQYVTP